MAHHDDTFLQELLATFREEATEHMESIVAGLLELEKGPEPDRRQVVLEQVYRAVHSLKGAARAVNLGDVETVCQSLEGPLARIKAGELLPAPSHFDLFQRTVDLLTVLLKGQAPVHADLIKKTVRQLGTLSRTPTPGKPDAAPPGVPVEQTAAAEEQTAGPLLPHHSAESEDDPSAHGTAGTETVAENRDETPAATVRMNISRLDNLFRQAEEMLVVKLNARQRVADQRGEIAAHAAWQRAWRKVAPQMQAVRATLSPDERTSTAVTRLLDFLDWNWRFMTARGKNNMNFFLQLEEDHRSFTRMVDEHLNETKRALMLPFATLTPLFPKMVRDMGRTQGKEIGLTMTGTEITLDRRVLEALKDPLLHLVRNSIDHGIENPAERRRAGKPEEGQLTIEVRQTENNKIEVAVRDDGRGVDRQGIVAAAIKAGILPAGEQNRQAEGHDILPLLLASGVTTSRLVTEISGRGLGLAIVKENVEKIDGEISLDSTAGKGSCFRMLLPAILSTFKGVFIRCNGQLLAIPSQHVRRVRQVNGKDIRTVENRETIELNGDIISLVRMGTVLQAAPPAPPPAGGLLPLVDLQAGNTRMAFLVDEILHEGEGLVKGLGKPLVRVRNIAGVTVLGSGELAPIVNVGDLLLSARQIIGRGAAAVPAEGLTAEPEQHAILVAEDSVTSRTLLKNILQSAGYRVHTAIDGVEAWTALMQERFDAVVSDIEMPRLDGFELTAKIRASKDFAELPVVLVTSLDSREDQERGIAVGANAYLKKSGFDQNSLLEVLQRLL